MTTKHQALKQSVSCVVDEELPPLRLGLRAGVHRYESLSLESSPWYESPEEVEAAIVQCEKNRAQVVALLTIMRETLTLSECRAMELHYLQGMSYRQAGLVMGRNASTVYRYVQRAIKKMKARLDIPRRGSRK